MNGPADPDDAAQVPAPMTTTMPASPSVLRALNGVQQRLEHGARAPAGDDLATQRAIARDLLRALDLSQDVALACVLRNQIAGTYALRHSVETAVVAALVARHLRVRPAHLLSLTAAALGLHTARGDMERGLDAGATARVDALWFAGLLLAHLPGQPPDEPVIAAGAHVLRMADRYCAGISARNYRRSLAPDDALRRVLADSPDDVLTAAFKVEIGPFPPGTMVRLSTGELGIVAHRDGGHPEVLCLLHGDGRKLPVPLPRRADGTHAGCAIAAAVGEDDCDLHVSMKQVWGPLASL